MHNLWKFGGDTILQTWMLVIYVCKFSKKRYTIKKRSITYNYIWHVDSIKCVYWLDTYSVKFWWKFYDIIFRHRAVTCPKNVSEIKYRVTVWIIKNKIRYQYLFSKYFKPLYKLLYGQFESMTFLSGSRKIEVFLLKSKKIYVVQFL